jgi:hypothetical protein
MQMNTKGCGCAGVLAVVGLIIGGVVGHLECDFICLNTIAFGVLGAAVGGPLGAVIGLALEPSNAGNRLIQVFGVIGLAATFAALLVAFMRACT